MFKQPATTRCTAATLLRILMLRRRSKASVNNTTVASPEVPTRMLNGGMSLSAILKAGQLTPQARLTATSMTRGGAWHVQGSGQAEKEGRLVYHRCWPLA